ncbi:MAG: hypothetical protein EGR86_08730 [Ruminiclostridium sp.]|nr:hypothetical protein [Ruminiclostridium sp.]
MQSLWAFYLDILAETPNPFPRKGAILLGLPPLDPVGGFAPATPFLIFISGLLTKKSTARKQWIFVFTYRFMPSYSLLSARTGSFFAA